jgi:transcriptional regulator with XRE-family HTH domain
MEFIENLRDVHIGSLIKEKLVEKRMSKTELAKRISKVSSTVHDIFDRKSIDIELLIAISIALDYDFIRHVYYKEPLFTDVQTNEDEVKTRSLLEEFIRLVKNKK